MRCPYAHEDGAYVLGALSPAERSAYERHLAACPHCRRAVADLAVLPGLLSRLPGPEAADYIAAANAVSAPPDGSESRASRLLESVAAARRRDRRTRSWRVAMAVLAVACLALVAGVGIGAFRQDASPPEVSPTPAVELVAMVPVATPTVVSAEVGLTATGGGTEVRMHCRYASHPTRTKAWTLRLLAYGPAGDFEQVGSWTAAPGDEVRLTGITRFTPDDLVKLELVKGDGTPLLTYHVP